MDHHHHQQQQQQEDSSSCTVVPPGFRFHPTEEELVGYYLARKVASSPSPHHHHNNSRIDLDIIQEVDLYRIEPWDLQERCGSKHAAAGGDQTEWYFFSYKDRKYPSGTRTNRATAAGFWKATGRDKPVMSSTRSCTPVPAIIGMRKTLVFYKGRAPHGRKTDWIMHEYRLQNNDHAPAHEEGWVVCRAFQKPLPSHQRPFFPTAYYDYATPPATAYYDYDHHGRLSISNADAADHRLLGRSSALLLHPPAAVNISPPPPSDDDLQLESKKNSLCFSTSSIPQLESPTAVASCCGADGYAAQTQSSYTEHDEHHLLLQQQQQQGAIDWSFLDTLLATTSQLHDYPSATPSLQ